MSAGLNGTAAQSQDAAGQWVRAGTELSHFRLSELYSLRREVGAKGGRNEPSPCARGERRLSLGSDGASSQAQAWFQVQCSYLPKMLEGECKGSFPLPSH